VWRAVGVERGRQLLVLKYHKTSELVVLTYCKTWQELAAKVEATDAQQAEAAEDRKRLEVAQITCFTTLSLLALLPTRAASGGC